MIADISKETIWRVIAYTYRIVDIIDDAVGWVIDALRRTDMLKNTLLIFTTDHGEYQTRAYGERHNVPIITVWWRMTILSRKH